MSLPGFLSWLEEKPGVLGPARLSGAGTTAHPRTLVAADDVYEGATLLRVPESRLLSALTAADPLYCRASALFRAANASHFADERVRLAAFLLHERGLGAASFYWPWLQLLPAAPPSTVAWGSGADEMGALVGSPLVWLTEERRKEIRLEYDATIGPLRRDFGARFGFLYQAGWDEYLWARLTVDARATELPLGAGGSSLPALVPLLDFAPYATTSDAALSFAGCVDKQHIAALLPPLGVPPPNDGGLRGGEACGRERQLLLTATRARAHGAAIRYSWGGGRLCNWQLMLARGEALRANPHDCMPLQMPPMPPEPDVAAAGRRSALLAARGIRLSGLLTLRPGEVLSDALMWLRIRGMSAAALSCWRKREADTPASARNESISLDDERVTLAELAALTKDKGSKYITAAVPRDAPARLTAASALRDSEVEMLYMLEEFCDETATLLAAWFDGRPQTNSPAKILRWRAAATLADYLGSVGPPMLAAAAEAAVQRERDAPPVAVWSLAESEAEAIVAAEDDSWAEVKSGS